jgi:hypothetical protein
MSGTWLQGASHPRTRIVTVEGVDRDAGEA